MVVKTFFLFLSLLGSLAATESKNELHLQVLDGGIVSIKIIVSTLNSMGQLVNMVRCNNNGDLVEMDILLSGRKAFEPKYFRELLGESGIKVTKGSVQNKKWTLEMDASFARWNLPSISRNEGAQLGKSTLPFWYDVENARGISIEAPYGGKWYPDIAVMDASMNVLGSLRTFVSRDQMNFSLPNGSRYLKVSSANGMKLLKEGMWIEHTTE